MNDPGAFVPVVFFLFLGAVIITPQILRSRDRTRLYETLRAAYEKGQPVPPELVDALMRRQGDAAVSDMLAAQTRDSSPDLRPPPGLDRDLRRGVVLLSIGVGLLLVGLAAYVGFYSDGGAAEAFGAFAALGAIPGCMGLAHIGLWWFTRRKAVA